MNQALLEKLIEKHNYVVRVTLDQENFLRADFVGKKENTYWCQPLYLLEINDEAIFLQTYMIRMYILLHIYKECRKLQLPYDIVRYYKDGKKVEGLTNLINIALTQEELDREIVLHDIAFSILEDPESLNELEESLEDSGILQNFNLIKGLLI